MPRTYPCVSSKTFTTSQLTFVVVSLDQVLITLNLNYNNIGNRGFVALSKAFRWGATPQLRELFLASNKISDGGLLEFVNAINQGKCSLFVQPHSLEDSLTETFKNRRGQPLKGNFASAKYPERWKCCAVGTCALAVQTCQLGGVRFKVQPHP